MNVLDTILEGLRPIVCIAGPTASGKSGFAIELADRINGEIVNADALQVYSNLSVLSARPHPSEVAVIPHHLYGHIDGQIVYSTGGWVRDAVPVLLDILARGRTPLLVGGTGLYFKALLQGLADIPPIGESVRSDVRALGIGVLRQEAERVDPQASARILGDDPQRLSRIVEVYRQTGQSLTAWQARTRPIIPACHVHAAVILPDRETLYDRINRRFDAMMRAGALDEAKRVQAQKIESTAPMLKAIGLSHLLRHLEGEMSYDAAIAMAKRDSRRLAKRQMTWFRNQTPDWRVLGSQADMDAFAEAMA